MFVLVVLLLPCHMWGSIGVQSLMSSSLFSHGFTHVFSFGNWDVRRQIFSLNKDTRRVLFLNERKSMCCLFIVSKSKVGDRSRGRPEVSLFNSEYTEVSGRALLLSLDFSTLPLIHTLYCWVLSKEVSSTIFKVFGMTRPGIEPRSTGPLANHVEIWSLKWY